MGGRPPVLSFSCTRRCLYKSISSLWANTELSACTIVQCLLQITSSLSDLHINSNKLFLADVLETFTIQVFFYFKVHFIVTFMFRVHGNKLHQFNNVH